MNKFNELYNKCESAVLDSTPYKKLYEKDWFKNIADSSFCRKLINYETISYIFFGALTTLVNFTAAAVVMLLCTDKISYQLAVNVSTAIAWVVAVFFAYITNKIFVFNSETRNINSILKEMGAFLTARLLSLGYEIVWMNITVNLLHWYYYICKIIAQFVIIALNYLFSKLFIFKKKENE